MTSHDTHTGEDIRKTQPYSSDSVESIDRHDVEASLPRITPGKINDRDVDERTGSPIAGPKAALHRGLSVRQVSMIAIAGTIGTGLFLGTGRSLANGGPASMLICYSFVGFIVYVTLLLLGEMATQYPVAGSFTTYATRFFSPSYGFALSWNYWFNDAVSVAGDLTAAQLLLEFWTDKHTWVISVVFWAFLVGMNSIHVKVYGELEYWLSLLKVVTILVFIIVGICVNAGVNSEHRYIGGSNWRIEGAPFVGGFGGFAKVFVTASFAYGGTESLGITAGETKNPSKSLPRVVKFVFWRILLFYVISILLIGLNVPYTYPDLANKSVLTSPFTLAFQEAGSKAAASFMNTVIMTSVLSAGNHALYAGTRVLYGLATAKPRAQAPPLFAWTTKNGVPLPALFATGSISALCFGSSFIGSGQLWSWLQNLVGVSNQIAWFSIGIASWKFRSAWVAQGRSLDDLKFSPRWTRVWGPPFVVFSTAAMILIQGWGSLIPHFVRIDFISYYIQIPIMIFMTLVWMIIVRPKPMIRPGLDEDGPRTPRPFYLRWFYHDIVHAKSADLVSDEYVEVEYDKLDEERRHARISQGRFRFFWRLYYIIA